MRMTEYTFELTKRRDGMPGTAFAYLVLARYVRPGKPLEPGAALASYIWETAGRGANTGRGQPNLIGIRFVSATPYLKGRA